MRAVQFARFGAPEVLDVVEVDPPRPQPGQVRVAVRAAAINPIDWKVRQGLMGGELPAFTGREVAGVVAELGEGVTDVAVGDAVFGFADGGAGVAEQALVTDYAPIPAGLNFASAAALPVAVETAVRTLDLVGVSDGVTVLVNGAAGAVGSAAVQIAVARGARVIGTASPGNHDYLRALGAEATTYGEGLATRVRELAPGGVDAAIDAAGGGALPDLVALAGGPERVVTIADYAAAQSTGVSFSGGPGTPRALHALSEIGALIDSGQFTLPVAHTYTMDEIAQAHELSETGHVRGKLVVVID